MNWCGKDLCIYTLLVFNRGHAMRNGFVMESLEVKWRIGFVLWYGVGLLNGIIHLLGRELIFFVTFSNTDRKGRKKPPCRFTAYRAKQSPCYAICLLDIFKMPFRQFFQVYFHRNCKLDIKNPREEAREWIRALFWLRADIELMLMNWQFFFSREFIVLNFL